MYNGLGLLVTIVIIENLIFKWCLHTSRCTHCHFQICVHTGKWKITTQNHHEKCQFTGLTQSIHHSNGKNTMGASDLPGWLLWSVNIMNKSVWYGNSVFHFGRSWSVKAPKVYGLHTLTIYQTSPRNCLLSFWLLMHCQLELPRRSCLPHQLHCTITCTSWDNTSYHFLASLIFHVW